MNEPSDFERGFFIIHRLILKILYSHSNAIHFRAGIPRTSPERCILAQSNACSNAPKAMKNIQELGMTQDKSRDMQHMSTINTEMSRLCELQIAGSH
jgi:hypothetical protein